MTLNGYYSFMSKIPELEGNLRKHYVKLLYFINKKTEASHDDKVCNPSYSGSRGRRTTSSRPGWEKLASLFCKNKI
jgi:hypothetical protein